MVSGSGLLGGYVMAEADIAQVSSFQIPRLHHGMSVTSPTLCVSCA